MESDVCGENDSPTINRTNETVVEDDSNCGSSTAILGLESAENVTESEADIKPRHSDNNLNEDESNDYYEVISADGSIGGEDVNVNDIQDDDGPLDNFGDANVEFAVANDRSRREIIPFNDLPFVPKLEFPPPNLSQIEDVSNFGLLPVNKFISSNIPRPDKNFTIPPPNFKPLDFKPSFDLSDTVFNTISHDPTSSKDENISAVLVTASKGGVPHTNHVDEPLKNVPGSSKDRDPVVDWLDENGDPVPGAFDYVKPDEKSVLDKSSKVEYVFSVREKKDMPVNSFEPSDVVNSGFLINQNVLHKNVAGNLGVLLENELVPDAACVADKVIENDEEKKLYEASKSGAAYKAAVGTVALSLSTTDTSASTSKVVPEIETSIKDRLPRFRRNRFTDIKKEDEIKPDEISEEQPAKTKEEVALERQAVTEILKEVQRGAARAREHGALGWQKCPVPVTNKTFLRNTLVSTLREPYRPPSKRGRFHVGLKQNDDTNKHHGKQEYDDDSSSRSSRSRSHSSSRSRSSSYSRSRSGSSFTDDEHSGARGGHFHRGGGRGSWHRGQNQYYDEAWAAYAAHYGYPWYGPEALPMFYGPEGWPVDPYASMYYGDPQAWMEYEAYYGPPHFGNRGMGRGFRGRGRGDRGRGQGGYEGDFREYNDGFRSPRGLSRSRSRSRLSRSWSGNRSRSRSRSRAKSGDNGDRPHSRSLSHGRTHSQNRSRRRSRNRSTNKESDGKIQSDTEMNEKKKKKKKKKKKHKKSKKSKHKQKDQDNKEMDAVGINEDDAEKETNQNKEKLEESKEDVNDNIGKEDGVLKRKKEKVSSKHKNREKDEKGATNRKEIREVGNEEGKEKKDGGRISENLPEVRDKVVRKNENKEREDDSTQRKDRQTADMNEIKKKIRNDSKSNERIIFCGEKHKDKIVENSNSADGDGRRENQDSRKKALIVDHRVKDDMRFADRERRSESQDHRMRLGGHRVNDMTSSSDRDRRNQIGGNRVNDRNVVANIADRDRSESQDSKKQIAGNRVNTANIADMDRRSESQDSKKRIGDNRVNNNRVDTANITGRGRSESQDGRNSAKTGNHKNTNRSHISTVTTERGRHEGEGDGHKYKEKSNIINRDDSGSCGSREGIRKDGDPHGRDIKYKGEDARLNPSGKYKSDDRNEIIRKDNKQYREGKIRRSSSTDSDSHRVKRQPPASVYKEKDEHLGSKGVNKSFGSRERDRLDTEQRNVKIDNRVERVDKETVGVRVLTKSKRNRSFSSDCEQDDETVDRKQEKRIVNKGGMRSPGQIVIRSDKRGKSVEREKHKDIRGCNEREDSQGKVKKGSRSSIRSFESLATGKEMKGDSYEKQSDRKYGSGNMDTGEKTVQKYKDSKEKSHKEKDNFLSSEQDKKSSKSGKSEVNNPTQLNKEGNTSSNNKGIEVSMGAGAPHSNKDEASLESKTAAENKPKGLKRDKKNIKKQTGVKQIKLSNPEEPTEDEKLVTKNSVLGKNKLKLKPRKKLKEKSIEGTKGDNLAI